MKTFRRFLAGSLLLAMASGAVTAAPAYWWKWRSKADGRLVCHQTPLGSGWEQAEGPFRDSHCEKAVNAR